MKKKRYFTTLPNHWIIFELPDNRNGPSNDSLNITFNFIILDVVCWCTVYVWVPCAVIIRCWVSGVGLFTQNQLSSIRYRKAHWIHGQRKNQRTLKTTNIHTKWFDETSEEGMKKQKTRKTISYIHFETKNVSSVE